ncbi:MAG: polyhydroxyalkanoate synthesis regulator DNA-binding domain-containing protein, partial [Persicimonas sp.]
DASRYVTLDEIEAMIKEGQDVKIIDNDSGEDITHGTLAHIVFEQERSKQEGMLPVSALRGIIQSGEEFILRLQAPVHQFRDEFRRRAGAIEEGGKAVRDFIDSTQESVDEMQQRIDDRLRDAVDQLTHIPEMQREVKRLSERVEHLEARLEALESDGEDASEPQTPHRKLS